MFGSVLTSRCVDYVWLRDLDTKAHTFGAAKKHVVFAAGVTESNAVKTQTPKQKPNTHETLSLTKLKPRRSQSQQFAGSSTVKHKLVNTNPNTPNTVFDQTKCMCEICALCWVAESNRNS